MAGMPPDFDARLIALQRSLARLEERVGRVEECLGSPHRTADVEQPIVAPQEPVPDAPAEWPSWLTGGPGGGLSLIGRTVMVLGGAFLLRAVTETGVMPRPGGMALGFTYGLVWLGAADRAGVHRQASATFHGLAALAIGLPLLWEASIRFDVLGPWSASIALALLGAAALGVAARRSLPVLAVVTTAGLLLALLVFALATAAPLPFAAAALALTAATSAPSAPTAWRGLRWPAAGATAVLVLILLLRASGPAPLASTPSVLAMAFIYALVGVALGTSRVLRSPGAPSAFDVVHTGLALLLGLGGGLLVAGRASGELQVMLGLLVLLPASASYALALVLASDRPERQPAARFLFAQAMVLTLFGTLAVFDGPGLAFVLAVLGGLFGWTGGRRLQPDLLAHGALYAAAATVAAGLPLVAWSAWVAPIDAWPAFPPAMWPAVIATSIALLGPRLAAGDTGGRITALARLVLATALVASVGTWLLVLVGRALLSDAPNPGQVAMLRSLILAAAVVILTAAGRSHYGRALGRLALPVLIAGGLKLLADDLWHSEPLQLFVTLAAYGLALMMSSKLRST